MHLDGALTHWHFVDTQNRVVFLFSIGFSFNQEIVPLSLTLRATVLSLFTV